jgi:hypothetical protein
MRSWSLLAYQYPLGTIHTFYGSKAIAFLSCKADVSISFTGCAVSPLGSEVHPRHILEVPGRKLGGIR